ncbi:hypothetical protein NliqN6_6382 [Naganishia liquefaciens]|uniref:SUN domain-containing protein n=1 Tax=Naganishia liquefaciens TaxID=104408 RepID=A0A8H3YHH1_9TREE|nr:hypothetical protein NliqN6_6382 [Naganishia liquefaciens]
MESIGKIDRSKKGQASTPSEPNRSVVGYTGTSINIANAMARAIESGAFPKASGSGSMSHDSDIAPRKETQSTLPGPASTEEQPNIKVSGGKRKKPASPRRRAASTKAAKTKKAQRIGAAMEVSETNGEGGSSEEEREFKSRRLMSPTEALLDAAQARVPAPELRDRRHSKAIGATFPIRPTTFTLRAPRGDSTDHSSGNLSDARPRNGIRAGRSPQSSMTTAHGADLISRYDNGRGHRTSQSPASISQFHSFSALVATGRNDLTGMDTTVEEDSMDSGETSGASTSKQNTSSISISALHEESSYEAMEKEVQANRMPEAMSVPASQPAQNLQTPTPAPFNPPRIATSLQQRERSDVSRQPFFPIPASRSNPKIPSSANRRRVSHQNADNEAYRPIGGTSSAVHYGTRAATDSADEDGGGEGLAAHLPERSTRGKRQQHGEGYLGTGLAFTPGSSSKTGPKKSDSGRLDSTEVEESGREAPALNADPEEPSISVATNRGRGTKFNAPVRAIKSSSVEHSPQKEANGADATGPAKTTNWNNNVAFKKIHPSVTPLPPLSTVLSNVWKRHLMHSLGSGIPNTVSLGGLSGSHSDYSRHSTDRISRDYSESDTTDGMGFVWERMSSLEATVTSLSLDLQIAREEQERSKLDNEMTRSQMEKLIEALKEEHGKRIDQDKELDQLRGTIRSLHQQFDISTSTFAAQMEAAEERVDRIVTNVEDASSEQRMMLLLGRMLPSGVPVRREPKTGQITIDPAFWTELRKVFATKADLDSVSSKVSALKRKQDDDNAHATGHVVAETPSWHDFLAENEGKLHAWADSVFDRKIVDTEMVNRSTFMSTLRDELTAMRRVLSVDASTQEQSTMAKVDKKLDDIRNQHSREATSRPVITSVNGDADISPALQRLIDDSLLKYSKDTLARPDFALASGGAQIVHDQTSKSMELVRENKAWSWLTGRRSFGLTTTGRMPEIMLHPSSLPGMCWPFEGSRGEVGILLSRDVRVTDITLEHAARELMSAKSLESAPKDIEVWAFFAEEFETRLQEFFDRYPAHQSDVEPPQKGRGMLLLARFQYSPHTSQPIQSFAVPSHIQELNLATVNVIVKVNSNWGGDYTCLYRIRVHGSATEDFGEGLTDS